MHIPTRGIIYKKIDIEKEKFSDNEEVKSENEIKSKGKENKSIKIVN